MGNKKNWNNKKYSTHKSKRPYIKKNNPTKVGLTKDKHQQTNNVEGPPDIGQGSRIVDVDKLQQYTDDITEHAAQCAGSIELNREGRKGLASTFTGECSTCQHTISLETSKKVKGPRGYNRLAEWHMVL